MKNIALLFFAVCGFLVFMASCEDDEPRVLPSGEPLQIVQPDSSVVIASGGDSVPFSLLLTSDSLIDTLRGGYLIDTMGITTNLTLAQMDTVFLATGFEMPDNQQSYSGRFFLPDSIPNARPFRTGDVVRVLFAFEAGGDTREKQFRIEMRP